MRKLPLLVASHLLLGGVAFFFARNNHAEHQYETTIQEEALASSKEESSPQTSQSLRGSAKPPSSPRKRGETHTSATFYAAWNALPDQKLSPKDRILAQRKILAEWAKVDLAAAMEMAISEGWDDSAHGLALGDTYRQGPYASALKDAFLANPE